MNTKQELRERIAKILKYLREEADRTQAETAQRIKIKMRTYQSHEEARAQPPYFVLQRLTRLYDFENVDQLISFQIPIAKEVA